MNYFTVTCSTLICPSEAFKCIVKNDAIQDNIQKMSTVAECLDKHDKVLKRKEYIEDNPYPNLPHLYTKTASMTNLLVF